MAKLSWDKAGNRYFETGVDRGVLYPQTGNGVAWNGLVSVSENPSGGEPTPYYSDGIKYLNVSSTEEFEGTIEAYTYPDEFAECDGTASLGGIQIHQQERKPFNLSYRTRIGNDMDGYDHGYKIHIIYNALAAPAEVDYGTVEENPEAVTFSWSFTTTPVDPPISIATPLGGTVSANAISYDTGSLASFSHIALDSRKIKPISLRLIEEYMYGSDYNDKPKLPTLKKLLELLELDTEALVIKADHTNGLPPILISNSGRGDLIGSYTDGVYYAPNESRLTPSPITGLYTLE